MGPRPTSTGAELRNEDAPHPPRMGGEQLIRTKYISVCRRLKRTAETIRAILPKGNRIVMVVEQTGLAAGLNAVATGQANRLPTPAPTSVTTAHQPKTTAMHVPRLTRVTHE